MKSSAKLCLPIFGVLMVLASCSPTSVSQSDEKRRSIEEDFIRVFPNDIVRSEPGCLKPDFSRVPNAVASGTSSIKITFTKNGIPTKAEIQNSSGNSEQNKIIVDSFMKCKFLVNHLVSIPDGFQRDYSYNWNKNPLTGLGRCMIGSQSYPMESLRLHEEGITVAEYFIDSKTGEIKTKISQSSGFDRLDNATRTFLNNCLSHDVVKGDKQKDTWINFKQVWQIGK